MTMDIRKVPISKVVPWEKNPRGIKAKDFDRLKKQILRLGVYKPLVCYQETGRYVVLGGNMRLAALKELGVREVEVSIVEPKTEAEKVEFNISDNDRSGYYEEDKLAELVFPHLAKIDLGAFKVDLGEALDLKGVIERFGPNEVDDFADDVPAIDDKPAVTKPGDLFTLGRHRLLCGDSTSVEDMSRLMAGKLADLVFTSPPYNCDIAYNEYPDKKSKEDYLAFIRKAMETCFRALADGRFIGWNIGVSPKTFCHLQGGLLEDVGFTFFRHICWAKPGIPYPIFNLTEKNPVAGNYRPNYQHEIIYLFTKGVAQFRGTIIPDKYYQNDVWTVPQMLATVDLKTVGRKRMGFKEQKGHCVKEHPAAFPVRFAEGAVGHLTSEGEVILDPFLGAGSSLIAAQKLGRACYGMEIDPKYCDLIIRRYAEYTGVPEKSIRATRKKGQPEATGCAQVSDRCKAGQMARGRARKAKRA